MPEADLEESPAAPLAPVGGVTALARELKSFDELEDEKLLALIDTHQSVMHKFKVFGSLVGVAALVPAYSLGTGLAGFWYFTTSGLGAVFGWLGARYYIRGEAKRLGLSPKGLKEYHRRRWALTGGADWRDTQQYSTMPKEGPARDEALRVRVAWLRGVPPKG